MCMPARACVCVCIKLTVTLFVERGITLVTVAIATVSWCYEVKMYDTESTVEIYSKITTTLQALKQLALFMQSQAGL